MLSFCLARTARRNRHLIGLDAIACRTLQAFCLMMPLTSFTSLSWCERVEAVVGQPCQRLIAHFLSYVVQPVRALSRRGEAAQSQGRSDDDRKTRVRLISRRRANFNKYKVKRNFYPEVRGRAMNLVEHYCCVHPEGGGECGSLDVHWRPVCRELIPSILQIGHLDSRESHLSCRRVRCHRG